MRNPFPVLDRSILQGDTPPPEGTKYFDVHDAYEVYLTSPTVNDPSKSFEDYGPILLPYPDVWMEFDVKYRGGESHPVAVQAAELPLSRADEFLHPDAKRLIGLRAVALDAPHNLGRLVSAPMYHYVQTDNDGRFLDQIVEGIPGASPTIPNPSREKMIMNTIRFTGVAVFCLGLMNCKNVSMEVRASGGKAGKKSRRVRKGIEYRVIKLPAPRGSGTGGGAGGGGEARFHTVRGHFKTYTEAAPLMGKLTGTYWWSHQVRGSLEHGEIISTYQVGK